MAPRRPRQETPEEIYRRGPGNESTEDPEDDESGPLGVPRGYRVPVRNQNLPGYYPHGYSYKTRSFGRGGSPDDRREIGPRYVAGDEWKPAALTPMAIAELQRQMAAAGLIPAGTRSFRLGVWDDTSRSAYKTLLSFANASGLPKEMALRQYAQGQELGEQGGSGGWTMDENGNFVEAGYVAPPLELRTTNREDLIAALRAGIIDKLGVAWDQARIGELADMYIARETEVQRNAYNQQVAMDRDVFYGGDAAVAGREFRSGLQPGGALDIESPDTFLENELRRRDPVGLQVRTAVTDVLPAFANLLEGWG